MLISADIFRGMADIPDTFLGMAVIPYSFWGVKTRCLGPAYVANKIQITPPPLSPSTLLEVLYKGHAKNFVTNGIPLF